MTVKSNSDTRSDAHAESPQKKNSVDVFIDEHKLSTYRDEAYKNRSANDQAPTHYQTTLDDSKQALKLLQEGKPLPDDLKRRLLDNYGKSSTDAGKDQDRQNFAIRTNPDDMKKEQDVINADRKLLKLPNLSANYRREVETDINSKELLIKAEKQDYWNATGYLKHDQTERNVDQRVANALKLNSADLIPALKASIDSKNTVMSDRTKQKPLSVQLYDLKFTDETTNMQVTKDLQLQIGIPQGQGIPPASGAGAGSAARAAGLIKKG